MSRWYLDKNDKDIYLRDDKGIRWNYNQKEIVKILVGQDQRIAELEEQLKNSVKPKFKVNDKIFVIVNDKIEEYHIDEVLLKCKGTLVAYRDICEKTTITEKNEIFTTKEEAQAKLEELGEKK